MTTIRMSQKGKDQLIKEEAVVLKAYLDPVGVWTIGVGHTTAAGAPTVRQGMEISREEALRILDNDLKKFEARVRKVLGDVPQHVMDGAASFDFNTGAIDSATWPKLYKEGKMKEAEASFKLWNKGTVKGQKVTLPGLVKRRNHEADLIWRGKYADGLKVLNEDMTTNAPVVDLKLAQEILKDKGLYTGKVDGIWGKLSRAAVLAYQRTKPDLADDGILGKATMSSLLRDLENGKK